MDPYDEPPSSVPFFILKVLVVGAPGSPTPRLFVCVRCSLAALLSVDPVPCSRPEPKHVCWLLGSDEAGHGSGGPLSAIERQIHWSPPRALPARLAEQGSLRRHEIRLVASPTRRTPGGRHHAAPSSRAITGWPSPLMCQTALAVASARER